MTPQFRSQEELYTALEVNPFASKEVLEAAYEVLTRKYDPAGRNPDEDRLQAVEEAYAILTNVRRKERFTQMLRDRTGVVIGNYRIQELIAEGGFGRTYHGDHLETGLPVCIKDCSAIDPAFDHVLIEEAQAMWDLRHFAVPAVRDIVRMENGRIALVMSYIPGKTLAQIIEKVGPLDAEHVAWITQRALNALMYLHYNGVVHGDIKPQNLIIQQESHQIVLVDFGLSGVKHSQRTSAKGFTRYYSPPEEVAGKQLIPESDFYSLGMTMIYALSGDIECVKNLQIPPGTPELLAAFIQKLIVRDPLSRPNWRKVNLFDEIQELRVAVFGRSSSNMKPIPGA